MSNRSDLPPDKGPVTWVGVDLSVDLLRTLAQALHECGQPAHRLEETLLRASRRLRTPMQVFTLPAGVLLSFNRPGGPLTYALRSQLGAINLDRLRRVTDLAEEVIRGSAGPADAKARLDAIRQAPPPWGRSATVAAYVLSAAAFAVFFGGGWTEVAVSTCVGLAAGILAVVMADIRTSTRLFELTVAAVAALIAHAAYPLLGPDLEWVPFAAGLIILLPGMSLVDAVEELAHGHLASGSGRLAGVGVVFLAMTFGGVLGTSLGDLLPRHPDLVPAEPLPPWAMVPALLVVAIGSTIRFRGRPGDGLMVLTSSALALIGSRWGTALAGSLAGPFLAALLLGLAGSAYGRLRRQATELFVIPGLALLVPGSVGFRSLGALLSEDMTTGVTTGFRMFLVAMALVSGLLFSHSLSRLRSPQD